MKRILYILILLNPIFTFAQANGQKNLVPFVNPFIGTGGHGHTFPGATAPFGFCQLSPDTRIDGSWDGCGGYHYSDSIVYGFSHTHLSGTGVSDYGDILLMPVTDEMALDDYQYKSSFSHQNERAEAGYYQVFLNEPEVNVALTASRRCGFHKYSYPNNKPTYVVLDLKHRDEVLDSKMEQVDKHTIRGYRYSKAWATNQKVYFEIQFEQEIENILYQPKKSGSRTANTQIDKSYQALIKLKKSYSKSVNPAPNQIVQIKVGISGVDEKGASNNLRSEIPHWDFDKTKRWVQGEWNSELNKILISESKKVKPVAKNFYAPKASKDNKLVIFYSALYHCMIAPNIYSDVDHRYRGRDDEIHSTEGQFDYYTVFSLWDTYRALHPLLTIIDKKRTNDFINTFIKQYEQGGRLPVWELSSNETNCMIGYHAVSVIWDAYHKGIRDYDVEKAFAAMKSIATEDKPGIQSYIKYGYVRAEDDHESVSKTLEYAYDDWCIAQMAKALGKEEDYKTFEKRSHNWINVYDPTSGFMRARKNSTLVTPFSPYLVDNNYTEANAWQYSFYVPHEIEDLIKISNGVDSFGKKLDALFNAKTKTQGRSQSDITGLIGQYAHGNEPSHDIAFLYHKIGKPEKGNRIIQQVLNTFYLNTPAGLIGNEDCGQMSAWYVLNSLGVYSSCPGKELKRFNVKRLSQSSFKNYSAFNPVEIIKKQKWNYWDEGLPFEDEVLDYPMNPFLYPTKQKFVDSIQLPFYNRGYRIGFRIKGKSDTFRDAAYPFVLKENAEIEFYSTNAYREICFPDYDKIDINKMITKPYGSPIQTAIFTKLPQDRKVFLNSTYSKTYHAGGPMGLVDGIYGKTNWRAGDWQGYQGQDFEAVIAFDKVKEISNVKANFLQDQRAWIFFPTDVYFYTSMDSIHWEQAEQWQDWDIPRDEENITLKNVSMQMHQVNLPFKTKYIKVRAKNYGVLPQWHPGRGNPAYIFIDEIEIE